MTRPLANRTIQRVLAGLETTTETAEGEKSAPPTNSPQRAQRFGPPLTDGRPRYVLLGEVGRGAMGVVHNAYDEQLGRFVALKRLHPGAGEQEQQRMMREARLASRLEHPGIVRTYDLGIVDGVPYFTMEFIEGVPLSWMRGLSIPRSVHILQEVATAVHHAHTHGVIHRDLKPSNVLVRPDGRPVVTDFGLARGIVDTARISVSGQILGTPAYMAPEQVEGLGSEQGPRTDVWALGATLYEMVTGHLPFGEGETAPYWCILYEPPRLPQEVQPGVSNALQAVMMRCLSKDQGDRYATAQELAEDLGRWLRNEPVRALPVTRSARLRWTLRRNRRPLALFLAAVVLALAGTWMWDARQAQIAAEHHGRALSFHGQADFIKSLGGWKERWDMLGRALEEANRAIECDEDNAEYHRTCARILGDIGRIDGARNSYDRATELDPNDPLPRQLSYRLRFRHVFANWLCMLDWENEQIEDLRGECEKAKQAAADRAASDPESPQYIKAVELVSVASDGRYDEALRGIPNTPEKEWIAELSACAGMFEYLRARDQNPWDEIGLQRALRHAERAITRDPWFIGAQLLLAQVYLALGRAQEALDSLQALEQLPIEGSEPSDTIAWHKGATLVALGRMDEARMCLQKLEKADAYRDYALHDLALLEFRAGEFERAIALLNRIRLEKHAVKDPMVLIFRAAIQCRRAARTKDAAARRELLKQAADDIVAACNVPGLNESFFRQQARSQHEAFGTSLLHRGCADAVKQGSEFEILRSSELWPRVKMNLR